MSRAVQIVIDCHDPHSLNRFWAEVLQYEVEDHHDQIDRVIAEGFATVDDTVVIDGRRAWATAAASRDPDRARCLELGSTKLWDGREGPQTWVTLADPEGNEFCVS